MSTEDTCTLSDMYVVSTRDREGNIRVRGFAETLDRGIDFAEFIAECDTEASEVTVSKDESLYTVEARGVQNEATTAGGE